MGITLSAVILFVVLSTVLLIVTMLNDLIDFLGSFRETHDGK